MSNKITYSVIVRNSKEVIDSCGHYHQSLKAAQACMGKLRANSTNARWNNAKIEANETETLPLYLVSKAAKVLDLAHNGHTMGTIAHDTKLSIPQIARILRAYGHSCI
jgi:hypothetical protein